MPLTLLFLVLTSFFLLCVGMPKIAEKVFEMTRYDFCNVGNQTGK